jgi:hypothetical protein
MQAEGASAVTFLDALVPCTPDERDLVERLRHMRLRDAGQLVDLGPLDEATLRLVKRVLQTSPYDLMLEVPRGQHDVALLLGMYLQLGRLGARAGYSTGLDLQDAIVVIGYNKHLGERLRRLKLGTETLSQALIANRVRSDGTLASLDGIISPASAWPTGLFHLNTSLGWPRLGVAVGVVVIDRTSFRSPDTFDEALRWSYEHGASRVIVISELGDRPSDLTDERSWLYWPWSPGLRNSVRDELGTRPCGSTLSQNALTQTRARATAAVYSAPALERLRTKLLRDVAVARKISAPFPRSVGDAVRLLNMLMSTWGSIEEQNRWAVLEGRGDTAASLRRSLERAGQNDLTGSWQRFRETTWPDLRRGVLELYDLLAEFNPRFDMLLFLLDRRVTEQPETQLIVRTAGRAAASAVAAQLRTERPGMQARLDDGRLLVVAESQRLPWAVRSTTEIRLGVPSPWRRSSLYSGEAHEVVTVLDSSELRWLCASRAVAGRDWQQSLEIVEGRLNLPGAAAASQEQELTQVGPIAVDDRGRDVKDPSTHDLSVDTTVLFGQFQTALYRSERESAPDATSPALVRNVLLGPDGESYLLAADSLVDVLVGTSYRRCKVSELQVGMQLVVTRGENRRGVYDRVLGLLYETHDIATMNLLLEKFRQDVWAVYDRAGASWPEAAKQINQRGGSISTGITVKEWATGVRIGPEDPNDIKVVARIAGDHDLTRDDTWRRVGEVAKQFRRIHTELGRCLSAAIREAAQGREGDGLRKLREVANGLDLAEVLEEFEVLAVIGVEPVEPAAGRRVQTPRAGNERRPPLTKVDM